MDRAKLKAAALPCVLVAFGVIFGGLFRPWVVLLLIAGQAVAAALCWAAAKSEQDAKVRSQELRFAGLLVASAGSVAGGYLIPPGLVPLGIAVVATLAAIVFAVLPAKKKEKPAVV